MHDQGSPACLRVLARGSGYMQHSQSMTNVVVVERVGEVVDDAVRSRTNCSQLLALVRAYAGVAGLMPSFIVGPVVIVSASCSG